MSLQNSQANAQANVDHVKYQRGNPLNLDKL